MNGQTKDEQPEVEGGPGNPTPSVLRAGTLQSDGREPKSYSTSATSARFQSRPET